MALSNEQWNAPPSSSDFYEYKITNSLRLNGTDQALEKTWGQAATTNDKFAISVWVKRAGGTETNSAIGSTTNTKLWSASSGNGAVSDMIEFNTNNPTGYSDSLGYAVPGGGAAWTLRRFRDPSAWYQVVMIYDSTQGTATNRIKIYINGDQEPLTTDTSYWDINSAAQPSQNTDSSVGQNGHQLHIGRYVYDDAGWWGGLMADFICIDGAAAISDFGEDKNGVWIPKDPSGLTFGNNGFWLKFTNSSAFGEDYSGNDNDFAHIGTIATHDQLIDSPTNNFCTINPIYSGTAIAADANKRGKITEGNLKHSFSNNTDAACPCTIKTLSTGKWYFEYAIIAGGGTGDYSPAAGIIDPETYTNNTSGYNAVGAVQYANNINKVYKGSSVSGTYSGSRGSNGDVMGIAVDLDNGAFYVSKNGTYQTIDGGSAGDPTSGASKTGAGATWTAGAEFTNGFVPLAAPTGGSVPIIHMNFGQDGTFAGTETAGGNADANGFGNFFTAPPTDYLAICTGNLTAAADPAEEEQPSKFFQALAYTGNGQNGHELTTTLKADSVWAKNRTTGASTPTRWFNQTAHNFGTGTEEYVQFDQSGYGGVTSTYQGYSNPTATTIDTGNNGYTNVNGSSYINYLQGSNGASVVNDTSGDIDVARFATSSQGMSVMYYTGTGTSGHTVPHGLGATPDFVIIKNSTSQNSTAWRVYAKAFGDENDYAVMNTDAAWQTSGGIFTADPTTSVMALADDVTVNNASNNYMAWAYANAEGMVKAGKYYGNANDDGVFVYTGFRPAMFMCKPIVQGNWRISDTTRSPFNLSASTLFPNNNSPQETNDSNDLDILSNGVKMRASDANYNQATTFHYLAFAENPFKFATAR